MQRAGTLSWQLRCDVPEELQFCGYIGQQEGFVPADGIGTLEPADRAGREWQDWWERLLARGFGAQLEQALHETAAQTHEDRATRLREAVTRARTSYWPPEFPELAHAPELQARCRRYWPAFQQDWGRVGGEKWALTSQMNEQLRRVRPDQMVRACAREAGRSSPAPFVLRVDFVRWPMDYQRTVAEGHYVLGARYLVPAQADALKTLLHEAMLPLV